MNKVSYLFILFCLVFSITFSQENEEEEKTITEQKADSLQTNLAQEGVVFEEVSYEGIKINPLAPSKAAFYSAILPGLGQIYNKRYWKAPLVWGALGLSIAAYSANNTQYNQVRDAFKRRRAGFTDDEFFDLNGDGVGPDFSDESLQDAQESTQRNRDLALVISIALYALNIIDANVDAHLKQYNVDERLGIDFKPYLNINPINNDPNYGLALVLKF
ncbi:DUF5683 domain-containing protein [Croceitalea vernalis]|uniref:DUF5683 domain-containing protein n=1 Tax=Croceitalea vernalis TaxID=3075599 RepID=A0ABU3BKM0_9FLAO|nr:DUF5683 domain-containing protein [Croceitalea sp. P007]MDT0622714.1 DUF5683 domain-containing protein [Croceitalea sp. P007]